MKLESEANIKGDLGGAISVKLKPGNNFNRYCADHIENYNPDRLDVLAVRFFYGKETIVTVYAVDKDRNLINENMDSKIPVKKFKLTMDFAKDLLPLIEECNFTLTTGDYPFENMEVINK